ncbi:regulatory protein [Caudoviricetes sp.]|nr:regulatory protein [Caudoviricetes sp.]
MRLAKMLRLYLAAEGIDQCAVAAACNISPSSLSRFLSGEQYPEAMAFARIQAWCADADSGRLQRHSTATRGLAGLMRHIAKSRSGAHHRSPAMNDYSDLEERLRKRAPH